MVAAEDMMMFASKDQSEVPVYGEGESRTNRIFELMQRDDLAASKNPKGAGVIVSLVYGGDGAFARDTARRTGWLVLDGVVYPIDVAEAQAVGTLSSGYPDPIEQAAGLG
ncbi:hypothetical protein [Rhodoglobus vestalii]|nr:hypothetical protein [Rhodoglobus vestalii]